MRFFCFILVLQLLAGTAILFPVAYFLEKNASFLLSCRFSFVTLQSHFSLSVSLRRLKSLPGGGGFIREAAVQAAVLSHVAFSKAVFSAMVMSPGSRFMSS